MKVRVFCSEEREKEREREREREGVRDIDREGERERERYREGEREIKFYRPSNFTAKELIQHLFSKFLKENSF